MRETVRQPNLDAAFGQLSEFWSPRIVAAANGQYVKVAKVRGEFVWHAYANEEEFFLVHRGSLTIRYRDRPDVVLHEGDCHVVSKGVEHNPLRPTSAGLCSSSPLRPSILERQPPT